MPQPLWSKLSLKQNSLFSSGLSMDKSIIFHLSSQAQGWAGRGAKKQEEARGRRRKSGRRREERGGRAGGDERKEEEERDEEEGGGTGYTLSLKQPTVRLCIPSSLTITLSFSLTLTLNLSFPHLHSLTLSYIHSHYNSHLPTYSPTPYPLSPLPSTSLTSTLG